MTQNNDDRRILIIGSSGMTLPKAIDHLRDKHPAATLEILLTPETDCPDDLPNNVETVHTTDESRFSPDDIPASLQDRHFEHVYVLYHDLDSRGYKNVEQTGLAINSAHTTALDYELQRQSLTKSWEIQQRVNQILEWVMGGMIVGGICLIAGPIVVKNYFTGTNRHPK